MKISKEPVEVPRPNRYVIYLSEEEAHSIRDDITRLCSSPVYSDYTGATSKFQSIMTELMNSSETNITINRTTP